MEFYASPTEMVITYSRNGVTMYYAEAVTDPIPYENPLKWVYANLRQLDFCLEEQADTSCVDKAVKTEQIMDAQQIPYTADIQKPSLRRICSPWTTTHCK